MKAFQKSNGKKFMLFSIEEKEIQFALIQQLSFQSQQHYVTVWVHEIRSRNSWTSDF